MMRQVVLGALIGFGVAVLLLAGFGTGGGSTAAPAAFAADAGVSRPALEGLNAPAAPHPIPSFDQEPVGEVRPGGPTR